MITLEQIEQSARYIVTQYYRDSMQEQEIVALVRAAINDTLEEAADAIEALERGTYTSAQTPAGLVRAMKVK